MRTLVRWDPFADFSGLRRAFGEFPGVRTYRRSDLALTFPVDLSETDTAVVVKASLPGVAAADVDISVEDDVLTVKGEKKTEDTSEGENYYQREIRYGAFARSVPLPSKVDHDKAEATFQDGVLTVTLPKVEEARPKTIKITATDINAN